MFSQMCFQLQPFSRLMSSSFSVRSDRFMACLPCFNLVMPGLKREARLRTRCAGHPRLFPVCPYEDVDGRDKPGHDACFDAVCAASEPDAMINSGLPIRTSGTLRGSCPGISVAKLLLRPTTT